MQTISDIISNLLDYIYELINKNDFIYVNIDLPTGSGVSIIIKYFKDSKLNKEQLNRILINDVKITELPNKYNLFDYRTKSNIPDSCIVLNISFMFGIQRNEKNKK